jgi:hypothetical protein
MITLIIVLVIVISIAGVGAWINGPMPVGWSRKWRRRATQVRTIDMTPRSRGVAFSDDEIRRLIKDKVNA